MKKRNKVLCSLVIASLCSFSLCGISMAEETEVMTEALSEDFAFLEDMSLEELEELQGIIENKIAEEKNQNVSADDNWMIDYYVDEFGQPTETGFIRNIDYQEGTFSNSAATNRELLSYFLIDEDIAIKLYEYGDSLVKNSYSRSVEYDITMLDVNGEKYYFEGTMYSSGDRIFFDEEAEHNVINALLEKGEVKFLITDAERPTTSYLVNAGTSNFDSIYMEWFNETF